MSEDLRAIIHRHDASIQVIEADLNTLRSSTLDIGRKMDRVLDGLKASGTASIDDVAKRFQIMTHVALIIGAVVSGIVYVSGNASMVANIATVKEEAARMAVIEHRLDNIYGSFGWHARIKKETE